MHKVIVEIRHAFTSDGDESTYLETVPRRGYRLAAPVVGRDSVDSTEHASESSEPASARNSRGRIWVLAGAFLLIFVCAAIATLVFREGSRSQQNVVRNDSLHMDSLHIAIPAVDVLGGSVAADAVANDLTMALRRAVASWAGVTVLDDTSAPHAYLVEADTQEAAGRVRLDVAMTRSADGVRLYSQRYEVSADRIATLSTDASADLLSAFEVLLDDKRTKAMWEAGTRNVRAFRMREEGELLRRSMGQRSMELGAERLRDAVALDPDYRGAYYSLGATLGDLGTIVLDRARRRELGCRSGPARRDDDADAASATESSVDLGRESAPQLVVVDGFGVAIANSDRRFA